MNSYGVTFYILLHKELSVPWNFCRGQTSAAHIICICMLQTSLYLEGDISPSSSSAIYFQYISAASMTSLNRVSLQFWSKKEKNEKRKLLKISFYPQYKNIAKLSYRKWKKTFNFQNLLFLGAIYFGKTNRAKQHRKTLHLYPYTNALAHTKSHARRGRPVFVKWKTAIQSGVQSC